MNVGIVTHSLESNYGGILQNYALQQVLLLLGHSPITINCHSRDIAKLLRYNLKNLIYLPFPNKRRPFRWNSYIHPKFESFARNIRMTDYCTKISSVIIDKYSLDAIIVGSDQVWRPKYVSNLKDMYLFFARKKQIKKMAYAASFGTNQWEYGSLLTKQSRKRASKFDKVSVRESSGVELCRQYLNVDAQKVLDPTLLLSKDDYNKLIINSKEKQRGYLLAYLLDKTETQIKIIERIANDRNLEVVAIGAHDDVSITVEQWLELFRDASYIVTDSFHGTVFSIIYNHEFIAFANEARGIDRFESLLNTFGLQNRIWKGNQNILYEGIDWDEIDRILLKEKSKSMQFLMQL